MRAKKWKLKKENKNPPRSFSQRSLQIRTYLLNRILILVNVLPRKLRYPN